MLQDYCLAASCTNLNSSKAFPASTQTVKERDAFVSLRLIITFSSLSSILTRYQPPSNSLYEVFSLNFPSSFTLAIQKLL